VLASGIEARLIEAEAALRQGAAGLSTFLARHDALRQLVGLGALDAAALGAMSQREREELHFRERAYWLWLTAHRLGDLRRLMWDYGRLESEIFPVGSHHRAGAPYGTDTNIPIPFDEQNNPLSVQCITRDDHAGRSG
jgi:starch-binding outer membrane protein, SusD/RagB family